MWDTSSVEQKLQYFEESSYKDSSVNKTTLNVVDSSAVVSLLKLHNSFVWELEAFHISELEYRAVIKHSRTNGLTSMTLNLAWYFCASERGRLEDY